MFLAHNKSVSLAMMMFVLTQATCGTCEGSGSKDKSKPKQCHVCHGSGQVCIPRNSLVLVSPCSVRVCSGLCHSKRFSKASLRWQRRAVRVAVKAL